jgi:hypothetical protein
MNVSEKSSNEQHGTHLNEGDPIIARIDQGEDVAFESYQHPIESRMLPKPRNIERSTPTHQQMTPFHADVPIDIDLDLSPLDFTSERPFEIFFTRGFRPTEITFEPYGSQQAVPPHRFPDLTYPWDQYAYETRKSQVRLVGFNYITEYVNNLMSFDSNGVPRGTGPFQGYNLDPGAVQLFLILFEIFVYLSYEHHCEVCLQPILYAISLPENSSITVVDGKFPHRSVISMYYTVQTAAKMTIREFTGGFTRYTQTYLNGSVRIHDESTSDSEEFAISWGLGERQLLDVGASANGRHWTNSFTIFGARVTNTLVLCSVEELGAQPELNLLCQAPLLPRTKDFYDPAQALVFCRRTQYTSLTSETAQVIEIASKVATPYMIDRLAAAYYVQRQYFTKQRRNLDQLVNYGAILAALGNPRKMHEAYSHSKLGEYVSLDSDFTTQTTESELFDMMLEIVKPHSQQINIRVSTMFYGNIYREGPGSIAENISHSWLHAISGTVKASIAYDRIVLNHQVDRYCATFEEFCRYTFFEMP